MSDKSEEWVIKQIQDYGLESVVFTLVAIGAVGFISGYAVGWWLTQKKTRSEIEKLKLENRKASGEILEKLTALRDDFFANRELVDLALRNMGEALREYNAGTKTKADIRACREEMCSVYQNRYLPKLTTYAESIAACCRQPDARIRAKTELIVGIKTMCRFLEMANLDEMLNKCDSTAFKLSRESRDGLFERVMVLIPKWCFKLRKQVCQLRNKTDIHLRN